MKRAVSLYAALLISLTPLSAQDLRQRVSLRFSAQPLEAVLQQISERYQVRFSYGDHPSALQTRISLEVKEEPLQRVLHLLLKQAGLTYKVIGGTVVLREQIGEVPPSPASPQASPPQSTVAESASRYPIPEILPGLQKRVADFRPAQPGMVLRLPEPVKLDHTLEPLPAKPRSAYTLAPVFSLDLAQYSLESEYPLNQELHPRLGLSAGLAGYRKLGPSLEGEVLLLYRTRGYTLRYLHNRADVPLGIPVKTEVGLAYLELPLGLQMGLWQHGLLQVQGTLGVSGSYLLDSREWTLLDDGRMFDTGSMQLQSLSPFLWALRGGAKLSYTMSRRVLLFAGPTYQYTGSKLKRGTQQIRLMELSIRSGIQFRL
ncbi:secretin and TonB N-terminal domain-containing protein [Cesiribacter andamanensis]|uniref:Type II secretory pathway, component HofQ n=1 Tax=Cesiribacter andamanensis AMV16 TaxID=1279009 RepID=M7MW32_9BACT|nr:secretin and TonB N-terminal domain-containing protein [Cesiribacter andamanensis]EMR00648.1 Type II secretory pathway, component HofQ [Cesiribacter andamanensis AMV16]